MEKRSRNQRNQFRVTVHGSGDGKRIDDVLLEISDLIAATMAVASKAYAGEEVRGHHREKESNPISAVMFE